MTLSVIQYFTGYVTRDTGYVEFCTPKVIGEHDGSHTLFE